MKLYPIVPGMWCVPTALYALTGADPESVLHPALNRHSLRAESLCGLVVGASVPAALAVLAELGYACRRYRHGNHLVGTIAVKSRDRWPGRALLVFTVEHALVVQDGRIYDSWQPHGPLLEHPFTKTPTTDVFLVERRK